MATLTQSAPTASMPQGNLKIAALEIHDTYGIEHFRVNKFTIVRLVGQNGSGKSSVIKALSYLFSGGTSPECIRKGADQSVISMELSDSTRIEKVTRPKRARKGGEITGYTVDLTVTQPDGTPRGAPQSFINELGASLSVDPSHLLRIDSTTVPGRRALAEQLVKLVPISFTPEEVGGACSYRSAVEIPFHERDAIALPESLYAPLGLDGLKKIVAAVTEQRRRLGITKSDTDGAINRLQKSLPEDDGVDQSGRLSVLETELAEIEKAVADRRVAIETDKSAALAVAKGKADGAYADAEREYQESLRTIEAKRNEAKRAAQEVFNLQAQEIIRLTNEELAELTAQAQPERERVAGELATVKERLGAHHRALTLRQEIEIQLAAHRESSWKYEQLSEVLQRLEALRLEKLKNLPVAGLEVEGDTSYLDGVIWENVNLSRRVEAVLQICCLQSGRLPLILWDDSEHADGATKAAIESGLVEAGYQLVEATVSDREGLSIEVIH